MTHTAIIKVCQLVNRLHTTVFFRMIEPTRTDRYVTFGSYPLITIGMTVLQFTILGITREYFASTKERPVGCSRKTSLITYPTTTRATIRKDNRLRLKFIQYFINLRIVVVVLTVDGTSILGTSIPTVTTIGTVEPYFEHFSIVGHQLTKLLVEIVHIFRCSIIGLVSVPRRKINGKLDAIFLTCSSQFAHNVTLTILIRSVSDTIFCQLGRPQAETVVMLGGKDNPLHTGSHKGLYPLLTIQLSRIEGGRV